MRVKYRIAQATSWTASVAIVVLALSSSTADARSERGSQQSLNGDLNRILGLARSELISVHPPQAKGLPAHVSVPLNGKPQTLVLMPYSLRSQRYQVLAQDPDGSYTAAPSGSVATYRGEIANSPGSYVTASILADGLHARVVTEAGDEFWIEPVARHTPNAKASYHALYRTEDILSPDGTCEAVATLNAEEYISKTSSSGIAKAGTLKVAELACDADYEYFLRWGSVADVQARIEQIINSVNVQYERDVGITHVIGTIIVRTAEPDPYTSTDPNGILNQFRDHWNANHGNIQRDVAHLFTGKNLDGSVIGIAWLNAICGSLAYGVSQADFSSSFGCATDLIAHELGHNWGANHCTCSSYTMNPSITCANIFNPVGTIPAITAFRDSRSCLDDSASAPPLPPANLAAAAVSHSQIDLSWSDPASDEQGFDVERSIDGTSWTVIASVVANTTSYSDTGLNALVTYFYRVQAYNDQGGSGYSNTASDTTPAAPPPPAAPQSLSATALSDTEIQIAWTDASSDEDGFKIERSADGVNWSQITVVGADIISSTDVDLNPSTLYHYRARAFNVSGDSGYSNEDTATTEDPPPMVDQVAIGEFLVAGTASGTYVDTWEDDGVLEAITERESGGRKRDRYSFLEHVLEFDVRPGIGVSVFVHAWGGSSEDSFEMEYSTDGGSTYDRMLTLSLTDQGAATPFWLPATTVGPVMLRFVDSDQTPGNRTRDTLFIDQVFIRTDVSVGTPPAPPTNFSGTALTPASVQLDWADLSVGEYGFDLERSLDAVNWSVIATVAENVTSYVDTWLAPNTTYSYRARTFNGAGYSPYSGEVDVTTPDGVVLIALESANGYKVKGRQRVDLTWSGGEGAMVDIVRDGIVVATVANSGTYTDVIGRRGGGSYTYEVCETGTVSCSNAVGVNF